MNLETMNLADLKSLQQELPRVISSRESAERAAFLKDMQEAAAKRGIDLNGVISSRGATRTSKPVAPKYRNPENPSETWSGRGRTPRWLSALETKGKKRTAYLIK